MPKLSVGIVGAGFLAEFQVRAAMQVRRMEIAGITSRTTASAERLSKTVRENGLGGGVVYSTIAEMADHVDAIAVYAPNYVRVEVVEQIVDAAKRGAEHSAIMTGQDRQFAPTAPCCLQTDKRTMNVGAYLLRPVRCLGILQSFER